jgi:hypothetical protein
VVEVVGVKLLLLPETGLVEAVPVVLDLDQQL